MPKISVIVPVYKAEKFLATCIESILNQTYGNLEIILVDDGSPDSCGKICEKYALSDSRVKVVHQKNAGVAAAMDKSRRKSRQKLISSCLCQIRHRAERNPLCHDKIQIRCHTRRIKQPRTRCPACRRHGKHRIRNPVRHLRMPADHRSSIPHTRTVNRPHQLL